MCHGKTGDSANQLKRDITDPISSVAVVKFIYPPPEYETI